MEEKSLPVMNLDVTRRYVSRPPRVDCFLCGGRGVLSADSSLTWTEVCLECHGTGLDAIPWEELFPKGRGEES